MEEQAVENNGLVIANIKWWSSHILNNKSKNKELPTIFSVDIPQNIRLLKDTDNQQYLDAIESFVYNFLTRKFGVEVSFCQIYLPLD